MKKLKRKAYTLGDLPVLGIMFGIAIIIVAIMSQIVGTVKTAEFDEMCTGTISENETQTLPASLTVVPLDFSAYGVCTITEGIANLTDGRGNDTLTEGTDYNITNNALYLMNISYQGNVSYWTYTFKEATTSFNITEDGQSGLIEIGDWFETMGLVIGAIIVIGVLFMFYQVRRKQ